MCMQHKVSLSSKPVKHLFPVIYKVPWSELMQQFQHVFTWYQQFCQLYPGFQKSNYKSLTRLQQFVSLYSFIIHSSLSASLLSLFIHHSFMKGKMYGESFKTLRYRCCAQPTELSKQLETSHEFVINPWTNDDKKMNI